MSFYSTVLNTCLLPPMPQSSFLVPHLWHYTDNYALVTSKQEKIPPETLLTSAFPHCVSWSATETLSIWSPSAAMIWYPTRRQQLCRRQYLIGDHGRRQFHSLNYVWRRCFTVSTAVNSIITARCISLDTFHLVIAEPAPLSNRKLSILNFEDFPVL